jgi:hypothetical protein
MEPDRGGGFGRSSTSAQPGVLCAEVGAFGSGGRFGGFAQGAVQPFRSGPGLS